MKRRDFLAVGFGALGGPLPAAPERKSVAAVVTEYRYYSHADVICGRILEGYTPDNVRVEPRTRIVSDPAPGRIALHGLVQREHRRGKAYAHVGDVVRGGGQRHGGR